MSTEMWSFEEILRVQEYSFATQFLKQQFTEYFDVRHMCINQLPSQIQ